MQEEINLIYKIEELIGQQIIKLNKNQEKISGFQYYEIDKEDYISSILFTNLFFMDLEYIISFVSQLKRLKTLDIKHSSLGNIIFLKELKNLTTLNLSGNRLTDISALKELKNLTSLDLGGNRLTDVSALKELKNLTSLDLYYNGFTDASLLKDLKSLTTLNLSNNILKNVSSLKELENLTSLNLSNNNITNVSSLRELKSLTSLDLSRNGLTNLSSLKELKNLTSLNLNGNRIKNTSFLKELKNLTSLDLSGNRLIDCSFLRDLKNLTSLSLSNNQFIDISSLRELKNLTYLDLSGNGLTNASSLIELKNLTSLNLNGNRIKDTSFLKELKNLTYLNLSGNGLTNASSLIELKNLTSLNLSSNNITNASFLKELKNLTYLDLNGNSIIKPPPEIIKQGLEAIRTYLGSILEEGELPLNEVKVLLVGDGGAGKTSLLKQLKGEEFNKHELSTHGINIRNLSIKSEEQDITAHFWDFGGQEIMHATHQFFLSERSFYILVLDGRRDEKTEYWLKHIESFGGDSPILIVLNKIDENPTFDVNRRFLQEKYKNVKGFYKISCARCQGLEELKEGLAKYIMEVKLLTTQWPKKWFKVKQCLSDMKDNYLTLENYLSLCENENITESSAKNTLLGYLHDLGVVLHFKDLPLRDINVINPIWLTTAVYRILNSEMLSDSRGILDIRQLNSILDDPDLYPANQYNYIIEIMKKFELCYLVKNNTILIPDLLGVDEPQFEFNYHNSLKFLFKYDFLPKSIMPRFIVKMNNDIKKDLRWRTGLVIENDGFSSIALIIADEEEKKIFIWVQGEQKRDYFSVIRHNLREINKSFKKIDAAELIPLPGGEDITVEYKELIGYEKANKKEYFVGKIDISYNVKELLNGIEREDERNVFNPPVGQIFKKKKWYKKFWAMVVAICILIGGFWQGSQLYDKYFGKDKNVKIEEVKKIQPIP
ncbi:MAG: GTP-binding protein [Ignavibacteriae bacterium]|nr:MAG: GTP-binding protein [Ignavibacteriota bacterium]